MHVGNQKENPKTLQLRIKKQLLLEKWLSFEKSCLSNFFSLAQNGKPEQRVDFGFHKEHFLKN
jgi:hypothetical protein